MNRRFPNPGVRGWLSGALALAVVSIPASWSQQPSQTPKEQEGYKIGVEVNLVTVPVTVRRHEGGFIRGLDADAFNLFEDGKRQEILTFAQEGVPTRIAIVLDSSGSVRSEWGSIKQATRKFVHTLQPQDEFALVTFNTETRLKMDWGTRTDRLDAVLTSVYAKDNTALWDAIWVVSREVFQGIREKKAMIIMSDGLDSGSAVSYKEAIEAAILSEAVIYVVSKTEAVRRMYMYEMEKSRIYANIPHEAFVQADLALRRLAYETGGRVLYPNTFGQLDDVYAEVAEELRNQYTLGYISTNDLKDGSYRRIQVGVEAPGAVVTARPGYYAPSATR